MVAVDGRRSFLAARGGMRVLPRVLPRARAQGMHEIRARSACVSAVLCMSLACGFGAPSCTRLVFGGASDMSSVPCSVLTAFTPPPPPPPLSFAPTLRLPKFPKPHAYLGICEHRGMAGGSLRSSRERTRRTLPAVDLAGAEAPCAEAALNLGVLHLARGYQAGGRAEAAGHQKVIR